MLLASVSSVFNSQQTFQFQSGKQSLGELHKLQAQALLLLGTRKLVVVAPTTTTFNHGLPSGTWGRGSQEQIRMIQAMFGGAQDIVVMRNPEGAPAATLETRNQEKSPFNRLTFPLDHFLIDPASLGLLLKPHEIPYLTAVRKAELMNRNKQYFEEFPQAFREALEQGYSVDYEELWKNAPQYLNTIYDRFKELETKAEKTTSEKQFITRVNQTIAAEHNWLNYHAFHDAAAREYGGDYDFRNWGREFDAYFYDEAQTDAIALTRARDKAFDLLKQEGINAPLDKNIEDKITKDNLLEKKKEEVQREVSKLKEQAINKAKGLLGINDPSPTQITEAIKVLQRRVQLDKKLLATQKKDRHGQEKTRGKEIEQKYAKEIERYKVLQGIARIQHTNLRKFAEAHGVHIAGDMPFAVPITDVARHPNMVIPERYVGIGADPFGAQKWGFLVLKPLFEYHRDAEGKITLPAQWVEDKDGRVQLTEAGKYYKQVAEHLCQLYGEGGFKQDHTIGVAAGATTYPRSGDPLQAATVGRPITSPHIADLASDSVVSVQQTRHGEMKEVDDPVSGGKIKIPVDGSFPNWLKLYEMKPEEREKIVDHFALVFEHIFLPTFRKHGIDPKNFILETFGVRPQIMDLVLARLEKHGMGVLRGQIWVNRDPKGVANDDNLPANARSVDAIAHTHDMKINVESILGL